MKHMIWFMAFPCLGDEGCFIFITEVFAVVAQVIVLASWTIMPEI